MKVAITGKGGVGKTTFASTLCRLYAAEGRNVLAADVDPDANLGLALGLTEEEVNAIVPVSKMKELAKERTGASASNTFFKLNPEVSDLPDKLSKDVNGVKLLVMGTVDVGGSGCVCPEHVMLKAILSKLVFRKDDVVVMDMEAPADIWCPSSTAAGTECDLLSHQTVPAGNPICIICSLRRIVFLKK